MSATQNRAHPATALPRPVGARRTVIRQTLRIAAVGCFVAAGCLGRPAVAGESEQLLSESWAAIGACRAEVERSTAAAGNCMVGSGLNFLIEEGLLYANRIGREAFSDNFQITGSLGWSSTSFGERFAGMEADLDVVVPLGFAHTPPGGEHLETSTFVQQGITRWWDQAGAVRNDVRYGFAHRSRLSGDPGADILGVSAILQHSVEYAHQVAVSSVDYAGSWGTGSFRYFLPTTGWRSAGPGLQERALEGMELSLGLKLTSTLGVNLTAYEWDTTGNETDDFHTDAAGARVGVSWRPHRWLAIEAGHDGVLADRPRTTIGLRVAIPLGKTGGVPRWAGLGLDSVGFGGAGVGSADMWRPVDQIGTIALETQLAAAAGQTGEVQARFVEDGAINGGTVQVEVYLQSPAAEDVEAIVQLVPGNGANPAVAGVDFDDTPVEVTIRQGTTSETVSLQLIQNDNATEPRSLGLTVAQAT